MGDFNVLGLSLEILAILFLNINKSLLNTSITKPSLEKIMEIGIFKNST